MANSKAQAKDAAAIQVGRGVEFDERGVLGRKQRVFVEHYSGEAIYRFRNGEEISRSQLDAMDRNEQRQLSRLAVADERQDGLVEAWGGVFVEPVNAVTLIDTHNLIVDQGLNMVVQCLVNISKAETAGATDLASYGGIPANVPTGMVLGTSTTILDNTTFSDGAATDFPTGTTAFSCGKYDVSGSPTYPTLNGSVTGQLVLKTLFPAGAYDTTNGASNIRQIMQAEVTTSGLIAGSGAYTSNSGSSIINLPTVINLGTADTLAVTVTWTFA